MAINIAVKPSVEVRARVRVLYDVIRELVQAFGGEDKAGLLRKGILERHVLEAIFLNYLIADGTRVALITVEIDWDQHRIFANSTGGDTFSIDLDPRRSVHEQIHATLPWIVNHTQRLREEYNVAKIRLGYRYIPEVQNNKERFQKVCEELRAGKKSFEWADSEEAAAGDPELVRFIEFSPEMLRELKITVEQVAKRK